MSSKYDVKDASSYVTFGSKLLECQQIDHFMHTIGKNVLHNSDGYVGVDIGSCDGKFGQDFMQHYPSSKVISVDPYAVKPNVLCKEGEAFIAEQPANTYDFLICKYAIHFIANLPDFFSSCYDKLKPGGRMYILTMSKESSFPWTNAINAHFVTSCEKGDQLANHIDPRFIVVKEKLSTVRTIPKVAFKTLLEHRGLSNLSVNTDEEIAACIEQLLLDTNNTVTIEVIYYFFTLQKPAL